MREVTPKGWPLCMYGLLDCDVRPGVAGVDLGDGALPHIHVGSDAFLELTGLESSLDLPDLILVKLSEPILRAYPKALCVPRKD